jgi:hypothetical protein
MSIPTTSLAERFQRFGERECAHVSPFYAQLSARIAEDSDLLAIAAAGEGRSQPVPNLLFAAVQYLLLTGSQHRLAECYPALGGTTTAHAVPMPIFRDFCLTHAEPIRELIATRLVQTNEVRRCALTLPALALAAADQPIALIEVGTSAGLNLLLDHYQYRYVSGLEAGDLGLHSERRRLPGRGLQSTHPPSPLTLICEIRGNASWLPTHIPSIVWRLGLDLNPIDVQDPDAARWLEALIWPEQTERAELLRQALHIAAAYPPPIWAGDAIALLPHAFHEAPQNAVLCIVHTFTLNQFSPSMREQFYTLLIIAQ